jgi:hypothetical protein
MSVMSAILVIPISFINGFTFSSVTSTGCILEVPLEVHFFLDFKVDSVIFSN